jgi:hypothetical protein
MVNFRDPKVLFGAGVLGALALLALSDSGSAGPLPGGPLPPTATSLTSRLSNTFFQRVNELAEYMRSRGARITGEDILAVLVPESGVNPSIANSIGCLGLNQLCPTLAPKLDPERVSGLRKVGFQGSRAEYLALPAEEQIRYVKAFFDNVNAYPALRDYGSLYLANFSPAFLGKPNNFVMYRDPKRGGTGPLDHAYTTNAGVDTGNKGYIEVADMAKFVKNTLLRRKAFWDELRMRLRQASAVA